MTLETCHAILMHVFSAVLWMFTFFGVFLMCIEGWLHRTFTTKPKSWSENIGATGVLLLILCGSSAIVMTIGTLASWTPVLLGIGQ